MNHLPTPFKTPLAVAWLQEDLSTDRAKRALLSSIDGHRNLIELESMARALGLQADAMENLRRQGLIDLMN